MSVPSPHWLWLALLAIPIIVAFLFRPPPQIVRVSSLLLFRALEGVSVHRHRPPLRELLCLALILLALGSLVYELAYLGVDGRESVVVILDNSASMAAESQDGTHTRMDEAMAALEALVVKREGRQTAIIGTAPPQMLSNRVITPGLRSLSEIVVNDGGVESDVSFLVERLCDDESPPTVIMIGGEQQNLAGLGCPIQVVDLGALGENAGISGLSARQLGASDVFEVLVEVASVESSEINVTFTLGDENLGEANLTPESSHILRVRAPEGGTFVASLSRDSWREDDAATIKLPRPQHLLIDVVTSSPEGVVCEVLRAHPRVDLQINDAPGTVRADTELIFIEGDFTVENLRAPTVVFVAGDQPASVSAWRTDHALLQNVDFSGVRSARAGPMQVEQGDTVLVESDIGPLAVLSPQAGEGPAVRVGFDLASTDFGLRVSFVNFVSNLIDWAVPTTPMAEGVGILSATESTFHAVEASSDPLRARLFNKLALVLALMCVLIEWCLQPKQGLG